MKTLGSNWPEEHVALLRQLLHRGSREWLAYELSQRTGKQYSKNAISGMLWRLKLTTPRQQLKPEDLRPKMIQKPVIYNAPVFIETDKPLRPVKFLAIKITDLQAHHCRYPRDGIDGGLTTYCGQPKAAGSYCAAHNRLCYAKPARTWAA